MIRAQITRLEETLRDLAGKFVLAPAPQPTDVAGDELLVCWREQAARIKPAPPAVEWSDPAAVAHAMLSIDLSEVLGALRELLENAAVFGTSGACRASATARESRLILELREPKASPVDPAGWARRRFLPLANNATASGCGRPGEPSRPAAAPWRGPGTPRRTNWSPPSPSRGGPRGGGNARLTRQRQVLQGTAKRQDVSRRAGRAVAVCAGTADGG